MDALNAAAETQVEAEWVRNAQNEFYEWLTDVRYTEDVSNATASIDDVDVDVAALNRAVERHWKPRTSWMRRTSSSGGSPTSLTRTSRASRSTR